MSWRNSQNQVTNHQNHDRKIKQKEKIDEKKESERNSIVQLTIQG